MKYFIKNTRILLVLLGMTAIFSGCNKDPEIRIYTYPVPAPTGMTPTSGYPGTYMYINGSSFGTYTNAVSVSFGGVKADSIISCTDTQIKVKVPATAITGKVTLKIWTHTIDSIGLYTVIPSPVITSVSSDAGTPGDIIKIQGTGFGTDLTNIDVKFNGTSGTVKSLINGTIEVIVPAAFTSGVIVVSVGGYPVNGPNFAFLTAVPNPVYQLDFEGNLNAAIGSAATYTQGLGSPLKYITGVSGQAVSLAGYANATGGPQNGIYNQIIALPTNVAQYNELTISCWVSCSSLTDWTPIFDFGATRGNRLCLLERASSGWNGAGNNLVGRAIFEKVTGFAGYTETNAISSSSIPTDSKWHHVVMTASKANLMMKIYLDGVLICTKALPAAYDLTVFAQNHAYIGANSYGTANEPAFAGGIDKFQIYNSELSANQVYTLFYKK